MDDALIEELWDIRSFLERKHKIYPLFCCSEAADLVARVTGLSVRAGYFDTHIPGHEIPLAMRMEEFDSHSWNYDRKDRLIVDLTADQFPGVKEKVLVLPEKSGISFRYLPSDVTTTLYRFERLKKDYRQTYRDYKLRPYNRGFCPP
jgi:hypothetical protein